MAEAKTGALLGCACALGALYAGGGPEEVDALDGFGREAGLAFQLIDDVIGIWGDPGHTGKPAGADLTARKKSLPVVAALASGTPAAAELAALYGGSPGKGAPGKGSPGKGETEGHEEGDGELERSPGRWSARVGVTGRRRTRPTGCRGRWASSPGRSLTRRRREGCWRWPSS